MGAVGGSGHTPRGDGRPRSDYGSNTASGQRGETRVPSPTPRPVHPDLTVSLDQPWLDHTGSKSRGHVCSAQSKRTHGNTATASIFLSYINVGTFGEFTIIWELFVTYHSNRINMYAARF